tara:strand:- start:53 stop:865 length:813 start_codon:yes stop_codon:yes gene_type:complete
MAYNPYSAANVIQKSQANTRIQQNEDILETGAQKKKLQKELSDIMKANAAKLNKSSNPLEKLMKKALGTLVPGGSFLLGLDTVMSGKKQQKKLKNMMNDPSLKKFGNTFLSNYSAEHESDLKEAQISDKDIWSGAAIDFAVGKMMDGEDGKGFFNKKWDLGEGEIGAKTSSQTNREKWHSKNRRGYDDGGGSSSRINRRMFENFKPFQNLRNKNTLSGAPFVDWMAASKNQGFFKNIFNENASPLRDMFSKFGGEEGFLSKLLSNMGKKG